ncbi:MAG: type I secretion system permease/ATPase [Rubrivivax sp.]|nr:type I secretion system permease/ATPase [Rubrivivax sp.]
MSLPLRLPQSAPKTTVRQALMLQRPLFIRAAAFTFVSGLLMLIPQWFMFEVYGRVLNSRNEITLAMLLIVAIGAYVIIELLDLVRSRMLYRAGQGVDRTLRQRVFDTAFEANLRKLPGGSPQAFTDLKAVRDGIASPAVGAAMDIPAALVLLVMMFLLHPLLGVMTLVAAALQATIVWATERRTMPLLTQASRAAIGAQAYAASMLRNAQVVSAMGMLGPVRQRWQARQRQFLSQQAKASDHAGLNSTAAKLIQTLQGSMLLGAACWLVLHNTLWGGGAMMIVASIVGGRVLAPTAQLVTHWRSVVQARDAARRVDLLLSQFDEAPRAMPLPAPKGVLTVEAVVAAAPGTNLPILRNVSLMAKPGEMVLITGPSASGKTCLARLLVGVWPAGSGKVRLDGVDVFAWDKSELGPHVGYLPQTIELFDGTVAENVARFGSVDLDAVRAAVEQVGLLPTIEALPQGFETRIGEDGAVLSGGQRQRLALARALYGQPQFLVLDEPNASLDEAGEQQLIAVLQLLRARGATVVVIAHRSSLLAVCDKLMVLNDGQTVAFGARDEVLAALKKANEQARAKMQPPPGALATVPAGAVSRGAA